MLRGVFTLLLLLCLYGCGGDFSPAPGSDPTSQPFVTVQITNEDPTSVSPEEFSGQVEACNFQLQNEFRSDWGLNAVLVVTPEEKLNPNAPHVLILPVLPDQEKQASGVGGYHQGNIGWVRSNLPGDYWKISTSHEVLELLCDEQINTPGSNLLKLFGNQLLEVCDPVYTFSYQEGSSSVTLSDYCTPAYYHIGPTTYDLVTRKPRYDYLLKLSSPK